MMTRANTPMIAPPINGAQEPAGGWQWSDPLPPGMGGGGAGNAGEVGFGPADGDRDVPATNRKKNNGKIINYSEFIKWLLKVRQKTLARSYRSK